MKRKDSVQFLDVLFNDDDPFCQSSHESLCCLVYNADIHIFNSTLTILVACLFTEIYSTKQLLDEIGMYWLVSNAI